MLGSLHSAHLQDSYWSQLLGKLTGGSLVGGTTAPYCCGLSQCYKWHLSFLSPPALNRLPFPLENTSTSLGDLLGELIQTHSLSGLRPLAHCPNQSMVALTCPFRVMIGHGKITLCSLDHFNAQLIFSSPHNIAAAALCSNDDHCDFPTTIVTIFFAAGLFY